MLRGRQAWQLPSRWRLHSHWRTHVSADLLKAFDNTCPERHGLIRWWCISSARAGLILTIVTAHQPVARWRVPTEVFAVVSWSRSPSGDFGKLISKSLERANSATISPKSAKPCTAQKTLSTQVVRRDETKKNRNDEFHSPSSHTLLRESEASSSASARLVLTDEATARAAGQFSRQR